MSSTTVMMNDSIMQSDDMSLNRYILRSRTRSLYFEGRLHAEIFSQEPRFNIDFSLRQVRWSPSLSELRWTPMGPPSTASLHIPPPTFTNLNCCMFYLFNYLPRTYATDDLRGSEIHKLARVMASYITSVASNRNSMGFHVKMDVTLIVSVSQSPMVVPGSMNIASPTEETVVPEEANVGEPLERRGASNACLERLKAQRFCYGLNVRTESETCAVCLEELSEFLTRLPCSHIFHESCIFEWLKRAKACPMCRRKLED